MKTIVFYSYKGGTGQTLALMHAAWILAREGRRVVVMDLHLEAPGVWSLLGGEEPTEGFVEVAADWLGARARPLRDYVRAVPLDPEAGGALFVVAAGKLDSRYLETLQGLDWQELLDARHLGGAGPESDLGPEGGSSFFDHLLGEIRRDFDPELLLIDAPTGYNEASNICLRMLADDVIILFGATGLAGVGRVVATLTEEAEQRRISGDAMRPEVFCVASALMSERGAGAPTQRILEAFAFLERVRTVAATSSQGTEGGATLSEPSPAVVSYDASLANLDHLDLSSPPGEAARRVYADLLRLIRRALPGGSS